MSRLNLIAATLFASSFLLVSFAAVADDIVDPGWTRFEPFTTVQEWEFHVSTPHGVKFDPDGSDPDISPFVNPGGTPKGSWFAGALIHTVDFGFPCDGCDGWVGGFGGGILLFEIPNIIDTHPFKLLQIQINGIWDLTPVSGPPAIPPPKVFALDGFYSATGSTSSSFSLIGVEETFDGFHRVEDWDKFPNPDFEKLYLLIPEGAFVNQVVIDTISAVPVPAALPLLATALIALVGIGARTRRAT